eukprot:TRINITY_DN9684_c0_g1_i1.p1 TRINITY_DN9684_c0_g1~~TRINITY_DN9684_c0_g1_i1.p1  ORF type:complete len:215 (-),score=61.85 TRINITY_DN9684_c0_g1_i1:88-732(-)
MRLTEQQLGLGFFAVLLLLSFLCVTSQEQSIALSEISNLKLSLLEGDTSVYHHGDRLEAQELWKSRGAVIMVVRRPGCSLCREEALELSSLLPKLEAKKIPLIAIVHEQLGSHEFFDHFFKGPVFLDRDRAFYKVLGDNWMGLTDLLRPSVWNNWLRAKAKGVYGNLEGEGRLLGGVLVVGAANQGILYQHREKVFGDHADLDDILAACSMIRV